MRPPFDRQVSPEALLNELRDIRREGVAKLGSLRLPELRVLTWLADVAPSPGDAAAWQMQAFLVQGVAALGAGQSAEICEIVLGLGAENLGSKPSELREEARVLFSYSKTGWIEGPEKAALTLLTSALLSIASGGTTYARETRRGGVAPPAHPLFHRRGPSPSYKEITEAIDLQRGNYKGLS